MLYGGEFTRVNSTDQQGLVRFAVPAIAPNDDGPRLTGADFVPKVTSAAVGVTVSWTANYDRDNQYLTYDVLRDGARISTVTVGSRIWWDRPVSSYVDATVTNGSHSYQLRATDPYGNTVTGAPTSFKVTTGLPTPPPATTTTAADTYARTAVGGWGTADSGNPWSGVGTSFSVAGGAGRITVNGGGQQAETYLPAIASSASDLRATVSLSPAPAGGSVYASLIGRRIGTKDYRARLVYSSSGSVNLQLQDAGTTLTNVKLSGLTATGPIVLRVQVTGTGTTTLRAKAWRAGSAEPSAWASTSTSRTAALQGSGSIGVGAYAGSGVASVPLTVAIDDLKLTRAG